jgi:DNA polymerase-3 subunit alpha
VNEFRELLNAFRGGTCPVFVEYQGAHSTSLIQLGESWRVRPEEDCLTRLRKRVGAENVRLHYS